MKPPKYGKSPGRPKKARKMGPNEDRNRQSCVNPSKPHKVSKVGTKMSCSLCKKYGHNRGHCPETTRQPRPVEQGGYGPMSNETSGPSTQQTDAIRHETRHTSTGPTVPNVTHLSTQESCTAAPQSQTQQKIGGEQPVKGTRKCSFCRKPGHSKKGCKLRQWTFRNSLDMTGELGLNRAATDSLINPYETAPHNTESGHVSASKFQFLYCVRCENVHSPINYFLSRDM